MANNPEEYLNSDEDLPVVPDGAEKAVPNLEKELAETKQKAEEYLANWQRNQADFTNYRRRNEQEKLDLGKYANSTLFCEILPVLDDLELAINHIPADYAKMDWVEGVRLVERKFKSILEKQGVKPVCALGMSFDPNLHEAIKQDKGKEGAVIAEVQKGYILGERLLRPSRVIVGSGEASDAPHPEEKRKARQKKEDSADLPAKAPEE